MNRQTILASVHHHLRESLAESGEERPLGEIVPRVAGDIRNGSSQSGAVTAQVIPIEKVAAFVDGQLDSDEAELICQAVMVDNSVLAEIIAAVRATHTPLDQLPALSPALSAQLLAMRATASIENDTPDQLTRAAVSEIHIEPRSADPAPVTNRPADYRIVAGLIALAATIVIAIVVLTRDNDDGPGPDRVVIDETPPQVAPEVQPDLQPEPIAEPTREPSRGDR